jgi:hypothetical protein
LLLQTSACNNYYSMGTGHASPEARKTISLVCRAVDLVCAQMADLVAERDTLLREATDNDAAHNTAPRSHLHSSQGFQADIAEPGSACKHLSQTPRR